MFVHGGFILKCNLEIKLQIVIIKKKLILNLFYSVNKVRFLKRPQKKKTKPRKKEKERKVLWEQLIPELNNQNLVSR